MSEHSLSVRRIAAAFGAKCTTVTGEKRMRRNHWLTRFWQHSTYFQAKGVRMWLGFHEGHIMIYRDYWQRAGAVACGYGFPSGDLEKHLNQTKALYCLGWDIQPLIDAFGIAFHQLLEWQLEFCEKHDESLWPAAWRQEASQV